MNSRWIIGLLCAFAIGATACGEDELKCGPGTSEASGRCLPTGTGVECGPGTMEVDGECVAESETPVTCGTGTAERNGVCVITGEIITCGSGTMLDANSGACVATPLDPPCGLNTAYDAASDSCLPTDMICAAGTSFDETTRICISDVACRMTDIVMNGICVPPFEDLWESVSVLAVEPDDPFKGGTATAITLVEGTELILGGTVDPPVDLDSDGIVDNDFDVFSFTATGPMWLKATVQSEGSALMGFVVVNADRTWERGAPLVGQLGAAREVLIPEAGDYYIAFAPALTGHATGVRWVGTVEVEPFPIPTSITIGDSLSGNLDLLKSGFVEDSSASGILRLETTQWPEGAAAAVMVFDGTNWVTSGVLSQQSPTQVIFPESGARFLIDPIEYGVSLDRMYEVTTAGAAGVPLGPITAGQTLTSAPVEVTNIGVFYTVDAPAGSVLEIRPLSGVTSIEYALLNPIRGNNSGFMSGSAPLVVPMLNAGTVSFTVQSQSATPISNVVLEVVALTPTDLGTLATGTLLSHAIASLPSSAYFIIEFPSNEVVSLRQTNTTRGTLTVDFWGSQWLDSERTLLEDRTNFSGTRAVSYPGTSGQVLFGFRGQTQLTALSVEFSGDSIISLGAFAPGDTIDEVNPDSRPRGVSTYYSFTVTADSLATGSIEAGGADVDGRIRNAAGDSVWFGGTGGGEVINTYLPAGDYTLEIIPFQALPNGYTFDIEFEGLPSTLEVEPNDTAATASPGLALGNSVLGNGGGEDWYSFTVTTPGIFTFTAQALSGGVFNFGFADGAGNIFTEGPAPSISGFLEAGSYTLLVEAEVNAPYILSASRVDSGATHDDAGSNDTAITAQPITVAPGTTVMGFIGLMDEDWYSFTLADAANFFIQANATTGGARISNVEILDSTSTPVPILGGRVSLVAGSYYLRISGPTSFGFPDYRVTFGELPSTLEVEPNDTPLTASPGLAVGNDVLGNGGGDDWYSFTATTPGIFTFTAQELSGGPILNFTLADSAGNTIANSPFSDISGFLEAGSYTLLVNAEVNAPYILSASRVDSGATHDDAGSNDTAITAQPITVAPGTTVMGFIGLMDEDWYSFTLTDATSFFIGANSTTGQTRLSNIEILDSTSTPLPIVAGQISLAAGSYYLRVSGLAGFGFPDYRVTFGTLPGTLYSSTPALAIPDNAPTNPATDIINVADLCTITNIAVSMNITHTWIGDLAIDLESPAGTTIRLWNRTGGSDDDIIGIFGVDLSSAEPLSGFVGEEAQGNWTISVSDWANIDIGVLNSWGVLVDCQ